MVVQACAENEVCWRRKIRLVKPHSHYAILLRLVPIGSFIQTIAVNPFCLQMRFISVSRWSIKSHNRSEFIQLIHTERFSCNYDCVSKSLQLIRTGFYFSLRICSCRHICDLLIDTMRFSCDCDCESKSASPSQ